MKNPEQKTFFWSVFSNIRTEYGDKKTRGKKNQKKDQIWIHFTQCVSEHICTLHNPKGQSS